ncbi:hypothetical protein GMLC_02460 [Geomonas limicola]|uniref:VCBS repeat-containing protein n=1 Tax=Geomonas limicola TaxID=2740186 RepID=A0A6V8N458_9BACT|nr:VCBS repeat-containing protein [Geomonas limicola]GFO66667.1 hypothetical protein GMLC_02460 [Geomonas limicola]
MLRRTPWFLFALLLVILVSASVQGASLGQEVADDFAPRSGYLVRPAGDNYLIDLDARQQVVAGDLFAVVVPGDPVVHPVTKALLGSEDIVKGLLQVTRVKAGYSECRALGTVSGMKGGDTIRRFQNIEAKFWDYTGKGKSLFRELQARLPLLQWQDYRSTQEHRPAQPALAAGETALYFILAGSGLEVRAPDFSLLHRYQLRAETGAADTSAAATVPVPAAGSAATPSTPAPSPASSTVPQRIWSGPMVQGTPVGLEVGDFDGDGRQEIAVAFGDHVEIFRLVRENLQQLAVVPIESSLRAYHLDGADLEKTGRMQLYLSALTGSGNPAGLGIAWQDGSYRITRTKIPWHLRRISVPGEGPVLAAQKMGIQGREYAGPVFRVGLAGGRLVEGDRIAGPAHANLYDFIPVGTKELASFARLAADGYLKLSTADGQELGETVEKTGGSEAHLELDDEAASGGETRISYLPARFEATERGEILVPVNSSPSLLARVRSFSKSQLQALVLRGGTLQEAWHTEPEKSYLADFRLAEAANDGKLRLITVAAFPERGPFTFSRKAALQVYSLPQTGTTP